MQQVYVTPFTTRRTEFFGGTPFTMFMTVILQISDDLRPPHAVSIAIQDDLYYHLFVRIRYDSAWYSLDMPRFPVFDDLQRIVRIQHVAVWGMSANPKILVLKDVEACLF